MSLDDGAALTFEGPTAEEQLADRQLRVRLAVVLGEIDPPLREVIVRRDILGESARWRRCPRSGPTR
jgi:DNA-directed RNA polymerase specialized sigma24 family protein